MAPGMNRPIARLALVTCAMLLWPAASAGLESSAEDRRSIGVTVYNDDLALVREVRSVELPAGQSELRFMDVPSEIRPETVSVRASGDRRLEVLEQNYEYDLLSPDKVLEKYVGRQVTVYVKNEETGVEKPVRARLLSVNEGHIFEIGDEISLGLPGRVVVPNLPDNLIARPTLVWLLQGRSPGARDLEVSYLTRQMSWKADYVAALAADGRTLDLTGWVTIDNRSGAMFANAKLKLVAGDVHVVQRRPEPRYDMAMAKAAEEGAGFRERELFEYHLYELERQTTLKNNQSKQIELLDVTGVAAQKRYTAESRFEPYADVRPPTGDDVENASVEIEFRNDRTAGLGRPLPRGIVRVYTEDADGTAIFAGEDRIDHTPDGETVRLTVGKAFDVVWERNVLSFREISKREVEAEVEVLVRNRKKEPVTVKVIERFSSARELLSSTMKAAEPDAFTLEFDVEVPARGENRIAYRVRANR